MYSSMTYSDIMDRSVLADERERNAARQAVIDAQQAQIHARRVKGWNDDDAEQNLNMEQAKRLGLMVPGVNAPLEQPAAPMPEGQAPAGTLAAPMPGAAITSRDDPSAGMSGDEFALAAAGKPPQAPAMPGLQGPKSDLFTLQRTEMQRLAERAQKTGKRADLDAAHKMYADITIKETAHKIGSKILKATDDEMEELVAGIHGDPTNTIKGVFNPQTGYTTLATDKGDFKLNRKELVQYLVAEAQGNIEKMLESMGGPQKRADADGATLAKITPVNNAAARYEEAGLEARRNHDLIAGYRTAAANRPTGGKTVDPEMNKKLIELEAEQGAEPPKFAKRGVMGDLFGGEQEETPEHKDWADRQYRIDKLRRNFGLQPERAPGAAAESPAASTIVTGTSRSTGQKLYRVNGQTFNTMEEAQAAAGGVKAAPGSTDSGKPPASVKSVAPAAQAPAQTPAPRAPEDPTVGLQESTLRRIAADPSNPSQPYAIKSLQRITAERAAMQKERVNDDQFNPAYYQ